ncbi:hypothetical protein F5Y15DRAFT_237946 [Xylariaceae sp. FL0016]|nr:hypothetical protein F5Y15DRAFT_237946 [Xylariaceae sp. FL0016]
MAATGTLIHGGLHWNRYYLVLAALATQCWTVPNFPGRVLSWPAIHLSGPVTCFICSDCCFILPITVVIPNLQSTVLGHTIIPYSPPFRHFQAHPANILFVCPGA